jgi:energy-coupling factor transporter ATP-binding protein EcfA2
MASRPARRGGAGGGGPCVESNGVGLVQNRIVLIVGFRGSGKSTVAATILKQKNGVLVFDPHGDPAYAWIPNTARAIEELEDYARWVREAKPPRVWLRYVPDGRLDPYDALNDFCDWAWTWRDAWVCIEEEVAEATRSLTAAGMPPELRRLVNQGRHHNLNQIYTGLRYAEIPRSISAGADIQILFRSSEPIDLDGIRVRIGIEAAERVRGLRRYEALVFFPDRSWHTIQSRDPGIAAWVMQDSADV